MSSVDPQRTFDVMVMATMSAGKSTLINALVGQELLHCANEAATGCLTSLYYEPAHGQLSARCYGDENVLLGGPFPAYAPLLQTWNADSSVRQIAIQGRLRTAMRPAAGLIIHDTPGPNNSQNPAHRMAVEKALDDTPFRSLCYVLNAQQPGTVDDRALLDQLGALLASRRVVPKVYFVLNKADALDPERGESLARFVNKTQGYLEDAGFHNPTIIPMFAGATLYARKALHNEALTRSQRGLLNGALLTFTQDKHALVDASVAPPFAKQNVRRQLRALEHALADHAPGSEEHRCTALKQLVMGSGVRMLEALLSHQRLTANPHEYH